MQTGIELFSVLAGFIARVNAAAAEPRFASIGALGLLGLGLLYGFKHAAEADHIVAISTIVSEHKRLGRATIVGALWGAGHTASLVVVGAIVLALKIAIPEYVASWLEFAVALMIIGLGVVALRRAFGGRLDFHVHRHRIGIKPTIVGAVHGLAGSAALTLLVLTQINSPLLGLAYLAVFGIGSILGMLLMSGLVGLPFVLSSRKLGGAHCRLQMFAGATSVIFGVWYAYSSHVR